MRGIPARFRSFTLAVPAVVFLGAIAACHHHDANVFGPSGNGGGLKATIDASATSGRAPIEIAFSSDVHGGDGAYRYLWTFGGAGQSTEPNPRVTFGSGGTYEVRLAVSAGDQTVTTSPITLHLDSDVRVSCAADPEEATAPASISFRADASGGNGSFSYRWDFGDGTTSTEASPVHTYAAPGAFRQALTVTSGGASATCGNLVTIDGPFHVTCKATPAGGNAVQFHATPSFCVADNCAYDWDFGGTGSGTAVHTARPFFTYQAPGTYTAALTTSTQGTAAAGCRVTVTVP
jgi:PKD repeat protein